MQAGAWRAPPRSRRAGRICAPAAGCRCRSARERMRTARPSPRTALCSIGSGYACAAGEWSKAPPDPTAPAADSAPARRRWRLRSRRTPALRRTCRPPPPAPAWGAGCRSAARRTAGRRRPVQARSATRSAAFRERRRGSNSSAAQAAPAAVATGGGDPAQAEPRQVYMRPSEGLWEERIQWTSECTTLSNSYNMEKSPASKQQLSLIPHFYFAFSFRPRYGTATLLRRKCATQRRYLGQNRRIRIIAPGFDAHPQVRSGSKIIDEAILKVGFLIRKFCRMLSILF